MSAPVVIHQLTKRYGAVVAVQGVDLTVATGETFGLLGPNGAGKTTTLECLVGLREPDAGEITLGGFSLRTQPHRAKEKLGVALQSPHLPARTTPREALHLFGSFYAQRTPPDVLLSRFGLAAQADTSCDLLSGGQQQRLALALAFVNDPQLIVLDEPTTGLDPHARQEIRAEIRRMQAEGRTVILSTHELAEAEQLCDRLAILDRGRVIATGTPRDLIAGASAKQAVTLVTTQPLAHSVLRKMAGSEPVFTEGSTARWQTSDGAATLAALAEILRAEAIAIVDLQIRAASLESIFLQLTQAPRSAREATP